MTIAFDNSPLSQFARAGRLVDLEAITAGDRRVTTEAVRDELKDGVQQHPAIEQVLSLPWLEIVSASSLQELRAFSEYARRLGTGARNVGEASVLAWTEVNGGVAILDERAGTNQGRERGVEVHGTLWLVCLGYRSGRLDGSAASLLVDALRDAEAWFPCDGVTFFEWAESEGLL